VLQDHGAVVPETSIIIEHLELHHPGARLIPDDPAAALEARLRDRFYDLYVELPMQKIVGDRLRSQDQRDPYGVEEARAALRKAYRVIEDRLPPAPWAAGEAFGIADCAAAPALHYADKVEPIGPDRPTIVAYLERLKARPSVARVLKEAEPYFHLYPA
jgi:glutathione S-transferase